MPDIGRTRGIATWLRTAQCEAGFAMIICRRPVWGRPNRDKSNRMGRIVALLSFAILAIVAAWLFWSSGSSTNAAPAIQPDDVDIAAGERLYAENCASCHGANLEGPAEGDWRTPGPDGRLPPPPHDESGHTWHHGDDTLFNYTKLGGTALMARQGMDFDSGMQGFGELLSDQEIWDILAYIKSTWPDRIRELQAVRSEAEQLRGN